MSEIVREEKASSISPSPARASFEMGVVNKTFVVIDAFKSLTRCVCSLLFKGNVGFSRAISQGIGPEKMREGVIGLDDRTDFANTIISTAVNCVGTIMRCTFCEGAS